MEIINFLEKIIVATVTALNGLLWGDFVILQFGETKIGLSIMVLILLPVGVFLLLRLDFYLLDFFQK